jgi:hypothetical protein
VTGMGSVGARFQVGWRFGNGRSGGKPKTILSLLKSGERRAWPHIIGVRGDALNRVAERKREPAEMGSGAVVLAAAIKPERLIRNSRSSRPSGSAEFLVVV